VSDYALERLAARQFEHVVQAIVVEKFGPASMVWGDGPDGGREATFEGIFYDPVHNERVNGYLVIQAKFLQRPHSSARAQSAWALQEFRLEEDEYRCGRRRKPDAYLFVTNAILTPPIDAGKDKLVDALGKFSNDLGMHFAIVWDYDQLGALLDGLSDIRTRFSNLLTPGDLINRAFEQLAAEHPSMKTILPHVLQKELVEASKARPQLNFDVYGKSNLVDYVIDLPFEVSGAHFEELSDPGILEVLLHPTWPSSRVVLLGGPGQGKSTIVHVLAQLNRAAILNQLEHSSLSPMAKQEIARLTETAARLGVRLPATGRLPFVLHGWHLANYIRESPEDQRSLWHYMSRRFSTLTKSPVSAQAMRAAANHYPLILIVDAYDEIAVDDRSAILQQVVDFADEIRISGLDCNIILSSRPQAYKDELEPHEFSAWALVPLNLALALKCAESMLVDAGDSGLLAKFSEAAAHSDVAILLQSPLHVVLVVSLLSEYDELPKERHRLFASYYRHVFEREKGRGSYIGEFLNTHRAMIEQLHQQLGLAMLAQAEKGGSSSEIAVQNFQNIARSVVLRSPSVSHPNADTIVADLVRFARERLVLIVGMDTETVGFQVKPIAEFLAAGHILAEADSALLRDRLRTILGREEWEDVARFALAAIFDADNIRNRDLRDVALMCLQELDMWEFSGAMSLRFRGVSMRINALVDARISDSDAYFWHLVPQIDALPYLQPYELHHLGGILGTLGRNKWLDDLIAAIDVNEPDMHDTRDAYWGMINRIAEVGQPIAREAVRRLIYSASGERLTNLLTETPIPQVLDASELADLVTRCDPGTLNSSGLYTEPEGLSEWARAAWALLHGGPNPGGELLGQLSLQVGDAEWPLMRLVAICDSQWIVPLLDLPSPFHPNWGVWQEVAKVVKSDAASLPEEISQLRPVLERWPATHMAPWPFQEALVYESRTMNCSPSAWRAAEKRWLERGVGLDDLTSYLVSGALTDVISESGFPFSCSGGSMPGGSSQIMAPLLRQTFDTSNRHSSSERFSQVAVNILLPMCEYDVMHALDVFSLTEIRRTLLAACDVADSYVPLPLALRALAADQSDDDFRALISKLLTHPWARARSSSLDDISPARTFRRAFEVLSDEHFELFCQRFSETTRSTLIWSLLDEYWIKRLSAATRSLLTSFLSLDDPRDVQTDDLRRLVSRGARTRDVLNIVENNPRWSLEARRDIYGRVLLMRGHSWIARGVFYML